MRGNAFIGFFVLIIAVIGAPWFGVAIANEDYTPIFILGGLALLVTVAKHGKIAYCLMIATLSSALIFPLPGRPYWWELAALLGFSGIVSGLVFGTARPKALTDIGAYKWILISALAFCALLVVLMRVHDVGLNIFGSETAGGRAYIQQCILISLPFTAIFFGGDEKLLVKLAIIQFLLSSTFLVSDYFYNYWNNYSAKILGFFELSTDAQNFFGQAEKGGIQRWQSLSRFGGALAILMMVYFPLRKFVSIRAIYLLPVLGVFLMMTTLGGHRSSMLEIGVVAIVVAVCQRMNTFRYIFGATAVAVVIIAFVYLLAPSLPMAGQRAVSFLPGIQVDPYASHDAEMTMKVRSELRKRAVELVDRYFWEGRGFGVNLDQAFYAHLRQDTVEFHVIMGRFYSGPVGIWVQMGVFGVIIFAVFLLASTALCFRVIGKLRRISVHDRFHCVAGIFCGKFVWNALSYTFITGTANAALKTFLPIASILIACDIALRIRERKAAGVPETAKRRRGLGQRIRPTFPGTTGGGVGDPDLGGSVARSS